MLLPAALMFVLSACGGSKSAASQGDVAIIVPCSGPEYQSNDDYYRANAMGLSTDMTIAKQKAQSTCRTDIATAIESKMKTVTDDYTSSYSNGENDESRRRFQQLSRTAVQQTLKGLRTICEQTMKTPDGKYKVYVAMEMSKQALLEDVVNGIKNDDKLRTDFEYERFKKIFDEEMKDFGKQ